MRVMQWVALAGVAGYAFGSHAQQNCEPSGDVEYVCGVTNPEDLVLVPGTPWIVSSGMAEGAGFYLVDSQAGTATVLPFAAEHDPMFASCATAPTPQSLNTHGLNVRANGTGRAKLYVVGHGAREAIEVFDIDATGAKPSLTWRGCVLMPDGLAANSVASFADGSIVATVLFMPGTTFADAIVERKPTGAVFKWSPGDAAFTLMEGTQLPANNGIEVSADGREIYVASSGLQTIVAFSNSNPARQLRTTRPAAVHARQCSHGPRRTSANGRYGQRRAGVRRPAGPAARYREAVGVPTSHDCPRDRSGDDARHGHRYDERGSEVQQRDDGVARRRAGLDRNVLGRQDRARTAALTRQRRGGDARGKAMQQQLPTPATRARRRRQCVMV